MFVVGMVRQLGATQTNDVPERRNDGMAGNSGTAAGDDGVGANQS